MEKRYNVFLEDVKCIETITSEMRYYDTVAERAGFYHPIRREEINRKVKRELNKLNNHKINLIRKMSFIKLSELLKILEKTDGLVLKAFKCKIAGNKPDMELLLLIDVSQERPCGIRRISDCYYSEQEPASTRAEIFKAYQKLENSLVDVSDLNNISKAEIIRALISFDNDELFENFLNSYISYLNNVFESAGI